MTTVDTVPRAGRREWFALAVLAVPTFLVSMDFSVLYLAVPHLTADLAPSGVQQLWIVDIYGFMIAGALVTMGAIGDRIGRKKLMLIGAIVFGAASVLAAFSTSAAMLVASRAALGVAGAAVMPSVLGMVSGMFGDEKQRARAITIWLTCFMGGLTLGPLVGGALLANFWWGSVFLVSVPGILVLLVFGPALLPEQKAAQPGTLDPLSVLLSFAAILPFIYGLKELARHGWTWFPVLAQVFGIVTGVVFVQRQRRMEHPLLDLRVFGNRTFTSALVLTFATSLVGTGTLLMVTLYLQNVTGLTPLAAGLLLVVPNVLMIIGNLSSPTLATHIRTGYLITGGLIIAGVGYVIFTLAGSTSGPTTIVIAMCVAMLGTGPLAAFCNQLAMGAVPTEKAGAGASILQTTNEFGLGLGVATLATLGTLLYRTNVEGALGSVPPDTANAARESVDRAIDAAAQLPAQQGQDLLAAARDAFTSGLQWVGIVSAILYFGLSILALRAFRHLPIPNSDDAAAEDQDCEPMPETAPATQA
jgi:MFS transporter, DHA2 family, multidrug resistance protein